MNSLRIRTCILLAFGLLAATIPCVSYARSIQGACWNNCKEIYGAWQQAMLDDKMTNLLTEDVILQKKPFPVELFVPEYCREKPVCYAGGEYYYGCDATHGGTGIVCSVHHIEYDRCWQWALFCW